MNLFDHLQKPSLIINREIVKKNIDFMAQKAAARGVRFRPHFKTHQSAQVGEWFRRVGVDAITVSSVEMAEYFTAAGWKDILIAFPVNIREIDSINRLAEKIHLGLLVESMESAAYLDAHGQQSVDLWIKIDSGTGRTGLSWDDPTPIIKLAHQIKRSRMTLRGLLTHAGFTYGAVSQDQIIERYQVTVARMNDLRNLLSQQGISPLELSVGDTPGCTLSPDLGNVDEIRPGNFVFHDGQMLRLEVVDPSSVAAVVACPVVARHPEREEMVIYGGAIHISKDTMSLDGKAVFGLVCLPNQNGWGDPIPGAYLARMSQEHGIIHVPAEIMDKIQIGDVVCIIPAHICLTVSAMRKYFDLDGEEFTTLN